VHYHLLTRLCSLADTLTRCPTDDEADWLNDSCFNSLSTPIETFHSLDSVPTQHRLHGSMTARSTLHLRVGSQVMFIRHVAPHIANGTLGKVVGFATRFKYRLPHSSPTGTHTRWPIVRLLGPKRESSTILVEPYTWTVTPDGVSAVSRTQVSPPPSLLCYWMGVMVPRYPSCSAGLYPSRSLGG
jgi:hypothetical protein